MTHVSLFTGVGGADLAAEWAGFRTVLQVENDPYCQRVLARHWPDVPRITDVREVTLERVQEIMADANSKRHRTDGIHRQEQGEERFTSRPINSGDATRKKVTENGFKPGDITVISGGFPCQPFSAAGKRRGTEDDRYLWPEMLRVIRELCPAWIVAENVAGLLSLNGGLEFESVCSDLERARYEILPALYPAAGVGAPHRRDRVFIVAHRKGRRLERKHTTGCDDESAKQGVYAEPTGSSGKQAMADARCYDPRGNAELDGNTTKRTQGIVQFADSGEDVPDADKLNGHGTGFHSSELSQLKEAGIPIGWWQSEPAVGRVAHGIPNRVDRLRALGNAIVPQQIYPIFAAITEAM